MKKNKVKNFINKNKLSLFIKVAPLIILVFSLIFQISVVNSQIAKSELERQKQITLLASLQLESDETNTYLIKNENDLRTLSKFHADGGDSSGLKFKQIHDITMTLHHIPIGNKDNPFKGSYDGQNYYIKNLIVNEATLSIGLFGHASGATFKKIILGSGYITNNASTLTVYAGGIAGHSSNNTKFLDCYNIGCNVLISCSGAKVVTYSGGIVGYIFVTNAIKTNLKRDSSSYISRCFNSATVSCSTSWQNVSGGLAGWADRVSFRNCMNLGTIKATTNYEQTSSDKDLSTTYTLAGGIVGESRDCGFENIVNGGSINSLGISIPIANTPAKKQEKVSSGITGVSYSYDIAEAVHKSYASMAGGISGKILDNASYGTYSNFKNCVNNGPISAPCKYSYTNATILSYVTKAGPFSAMDRFDFNAGKDIIKLSVENAFQIGYNLANADLSSCYYLDNTTADIKKTTVFMPNFSTATATYKYMITSSTTNSNGATIINDIDKTLYPKDYSRYNNTNYAWTEGRSALKYRSEKSLEFTLTKTGFDCWHKGKYDTLTSAGLVWARGLDPNLVGPPAPGQENYYSLFINFSGTCHKESGILFWHEEWAEPVSEYVPILSANVQDLESSISNGCSGNNQIFKTDTIVKALGDTTWTMDPNINDGYPVLKHFIWSQSQSIPK